MQKQREKKIILGIIILYCLFVIGLVATVVFGRTQGLLRTNEEIAKTNQFGINSPIFGETEDVRFFAGIKSQNKFGGEDYYNGASLEIGEDAKLLFEITVYNEGKLKNPKIEIDGKNYNVQMNTPKDEVLKADAIGNNIKTIELNDIEAGTSYNSVELYGSIRSGTYSNQDSMNAALNRNVNNYYRDDSKVKFTATFVDRDGVEKELNKELPIVVDWRGNLHAQIDQTEQKYTDTNTKVNEEEKTVELSFNIISQETLRQLYLTNSRVDAYIPQLNGYNPISVETDAQLEAIFNPESRMFTMRNWPAIDDDGTILREIPRDIYYTVRVKYPLEAYENIDQNTFKLFVPVRILYNLPTNIESFNMYVLGDEYYMGKSIFPFYRGGMSFEGNSSSYASMIRTMFPVYGDEVLDFYTLFQGGTGVIPLTFEKHEPTEEMVNLTVGKKIETPNGIDYVVSNPAKMINIIQSIMDSNLVNQIKYLLQGMGPEGAIDNFTKILTYEVKYDVQTIDNSIDKVTIAEKENFFVKENGTILNADGDTTTIGIWFETEEKKAQGMRAIAKEAETGLVLKEFDGSEIVKYSKDNPFYFMITPSNKIIIELENVPENTFIRVANIKMPLGPTSGMEKMAEYKNYKEIGSKADITRDGNTIEVSNKANFEQYYSKATISVDNQVIKTTETTNEETIRISTGAYIDMGDEQLYTYLRMYLFKKYGMTVNTNQLSRDIITKYRQNDGHISVQEIEKILANVTNNNNEINSKADLIATKVIDKLHEENESGQYSPYGPYGNITMYLFTEFHLPMSFYTMNLQSYLMQNYTIDKDVLINDYLRPALLDNEYYVHATSIKMSLETFKQRVYQEEILSDLKESIYKIMSENGAPWLNGNFLVAFPEEIQDVKINNVEINNSQVKIKGYEKYEENGRIFIRIITENGVISPGYEIKLDVEMTSKLGVENGTKDIELYAKNGIGDPYFNEVQDSFDVDSNQNREEPVHKDTAEVDFETLGYMITRTFITNGNTVNIDVMNNYTVEAKGVHILGRIPFEGNKSVISNYDLGSTTTLNMTENGISVPEQLPGHATIYYSSKADATDDLEKEENGWTLAPEDWTQVKSYLITLEDVLLQKGNNYEFSYKVEFPRIMSEDERAFVNHAIFYGYSLDEGEYKGKAESNIAELRAIEKTGNLKVITTLEGTENVVKHTRFELYADGTIKRAVSDENGVVTFSGLEYGKTYKLDQIDLTTNEKLSDYTTYVTLNWQGDTLTPNTSGQRVYKTEVEENTATLYLMRLKTAKVTIEGLPNGSKTITAFKESYYGVKTYYFNVTDEETITINNLPTNQDIELSIAGEDAIGNIQFGFYKYNDGYQIEVWGEGIEETESSEDEDGVIVGRIKLNVLEREKLPIEITKVSMEHRVDPQTGVESTEAVPVEGAELSFYNNGRNIGKYTTDANGKIYLNNVYYGDRVTVKETKVPEGYIPIETFAFDYYRTYNDPSNTKEAYVEGVDEFTQKDDGTICFNIVDEKLESYKIIKKDEETGQRIAGAKFAIYDIHSLEPARDITNNFAGTEETIDGKTYYTFTTNENGEINILLPKGLYRVEEVKADEKYDISKAYGYIGEDEDLESFSNYRSYLPAYNDNEYVAINNIIKTRDDGYLVDISCADGIKGVSLPKIGSDYQYLIKYDANNQIEWTNSLLYNTSNNCLVQTKDGGYLLSSASTVYKLNTDGQVVWSKWINTLNMGATSGLTETKDGGVAFVFNASSITEEGFINQNPNGQGSKDLYVVKLNNLGKTEWIKEIGGQGEDKSFGLYEKDNGNLILAATLKTKWLEINDEINESTFEGKDEVNVILTFDKDGNVKDYVESTYQPMSFEGLNKSKDGYYQFGRAYETVETIDGQTFIDDNIGRTYPYIIKYDENFNALWVKRIKSNIAYIKDIVDRENGGSYLRFYKNGGSLSFDGWSLQEYGEYIAQLSEEGTTLDIVQLKEYSDNSYKRVTCEIKPGIVLTRNERGISYYNLIDMSIFGDYSTSTNELTISNTVKKYTIKATKSGDGGTISGPSDGIQETVRHGESSTQPIVITPSAGFRIETIEINGDAIDFVPQANGSYTIPIFTNVTEDKSIVVTFVNEAHEIIINKVDDRSGVGIPNTEFTLERINEGTTINNPVGNLVGCDIPNAVTNTDRNYASSVVKYNDLTAVTTDYYYVADGNGMFVPTNSKTYQLQNGGTAGIKSSSAHSYIPLDFTGLEGTYQVEVTFDCNCNSSDKVYVDLTSQTNSSGTAAGSTTGNKPNPVTKSEDATGGNMYYLHIRYDKGSSSDYGNDWGRIRRINVYKIENQVYNFKKVDNYYYNTNGKYTGTTGESYIPIDLRNGSGKYQILFGAEVAGSDIKGIARLTETPDASTSNSSAVIGFSNGLATTIVPGGRMYYLHFEARNTNATNKDDGYVKFSNILVSPITDNSLWTAVIKTDENGKAVADIPYGKYRIIETKSAENYKPLEFAQEIEFTENGTKEFTITNEKYKKVIVHHYKKGTTEKIAEDEIYTGTRGSEYKTFPIVDVSEYELEKDGLGNAILPSNREGVFADNSDTVVNYYYVEKPIKLTVHHYIEGTYINVPLADGTYAEDVITTGTVGQEYTTSALPADVVSQKYELALVPENAQGTYFGDEVVVTYFYKRSFDELIINKIDEETGEPIENAVFDVFYNKYKYTDEFEEFINNGPVYTEDNITLGNPVDIEVGFIPRDHEQTFNKLGDKYYAENTSYFSLLSGRPGFNDFDEVASAMFYVDLRNVSGTYALKINAEGVLPFNLENLLYYNGNYNGGLNGGGPWNPATNANIGDKSPSIMRTTGDGGDNVKPGYYRFLACVIEGQEDLGDMEGFEDMSNARILFDMIRTTEAKDYIVSLEGGKKYYIPVAFLRGYGAYIGDEQKANLGERINVQKVGDGNSTDTMGMEAGIINTIQVYKADINPINRKYYFEKNNKGQFISNNQGKEGTTAVTTIPIDLTGFDGDKYTLTVNAEIFNTGYNGTGMIAVSENPGVEFYFNPLAVIGRQEFSSQLEYLQDRMGIYILTEEPYSFRGDYRVMAILRNYVEPKDYTIELDGGRMYYLHWIYDKPNTVKWAMEIFDYLFGYNGRNFHSGIGSNISPKAKTQKTTYGSEKKELKTYVADGALDAMIINSVTLETSVHKRVRTNEEGWAKVGVPVGTITIKEVSVPDDYTLKEDPIEVEVGQAGAEVTVGNRKKKGQVIVHHYIEGTTTKVPSSTEGVPVADEIKTGKPGEIYASKPTTNLPREYVYVSSTEPTYGEYTEGTKEIIYYYKSIASKVTVHHYLDPEETDGLVVSVARDEVTNGIIGDEYTSSSIIEPGVPTKYELVRVVGEPEGVLGEEDTEVTYYYKTKQSTVTFKYLEKGTDKVLADEEYQTDKVDSLYRSDAKEIEGYELVETVGDNVGLLTIEPIEVIFYYKQKTYATVKYIDIETGEEMDNRLMLYRLEENPGEGDEFEDSTEVINGLVGDEYLSRVRVKAFEGYTLEERPEVLPDTLDYEPFTLVYKYRKIPDVVGTVVERHVDVNSRDVIYEEIHTGPEDSSYELIAPEHDGYILMDPENNSKPAEDEVKEEGVYTETPKNVTFYYSKRTHVTVRYVDSHTGEELTDEPIVIEGYENLYYETENKEFDGYKLDKLPENNKGQMKDTPIEVVYEYSHLSGGVVINYKDIADGHQLKDEEKKEGYVGETCTVSEAHIDGYEIVREQYPEETTIEFTEETQYVTFYYKKIVKVIIKYVDRQTGEVITIYNEDDDTEIDTTETESGYQGDDYTTNSKEIPGYDLIIVPTNKDGTLDADDVEVIYYYARKAKVITRFFDDETDEPIAEEVVNDNLHEGDDYETQPEEIEYYVLLENKLPNNAKGKVVLNETTQPLNEEEEEDLESATNNIIFVDYYYRKKTFNLSIDKKIKQTNVNGIVTSVNDTLAKLELDRRLLNTYAVEVTYEITVANNSELEGTCEVVESIPNGFTIDNLKNPLWNIEGNTATLTAKVKPGESKVYTIVLDWKPTETDMGSKVNVVKIEDEANDAQFEETTAKDNQSQANLIVSLSTGAESNSIIEAVALTALVVSMGACVYYIRRKN